jgi:hypothetical protein
MKRILVPVLLAMALAQAGRLGASGPGYHELRGQIPVTFFRDGGFGGVNPNVRVSIDGREVGTLSAGESKTFYAKPGRIVIGVGAWKTERRFTRTIVAGGDLRFRIEAADRNQFVVRQVSPISR